MMIPLVEMSSLKTWGRIFTLHMPQNSVSTNETALPFFFFKRTKMTDSEKVYAAFEKAGKPLKAGEVAEITGIDKPQVSKIIKSLQKEGKLTSPKRCYYAPS